MRFLIDAQLPPALAKYLVAKGHEAVHVQELGLRHATDSVIWREALSGQFVIVTKDEDFLLRSESASQSPSIVWIRKGNCNNSALLNWFQPLLPQIEKFLVQGSRVVEVV